MARMHPRTLLAADLKSKGEENVFDAADAWQRCAALYEKAYRRALALGDRPSATGP